MLGRLSGTALFLKTVKGQDEKSTFMHFKKSVMSSDSVIDNVFILIIILRPNNYFVAIVAHIILIIV